MEMYYHPILGLQYWFHEPIFKIDMDYLKENEMANIEKLVDLIKQQGIVIMGSNENPSTSVSWFGIISNF